MGASRVNALVASGSIEHVLVGTKDFHWQVHRKRCFQQIPTALCFCSQRFLWTSPLRSRGANQSARAQRRWSHKSAAESGLPLSGMEARHDISKALPFYPESGGCFIEFSALGRLHHSLQDRLACWVWFVGASRWPGGSRYCWKNAWARSFMDTWVLPCSGVASSGRGRGAIL